MEAEKGMTGTPEEGWGWVEVCGLETECVLGVYPEERERERPVAMDVALEVRTAAAAREDDFAKALNYERVEADLRALAREGRFRLVETLAERAAARCLEYEGVRRARVRVEKPGALKHARTVAVSVERDNFNAEARRTRRGTRKKNSD